MNALTPTDLRKIYGMNLPASNDDIWQECIDTAEDQCRRVLDIGPDWSSSKTIYFDSAELANGLLVLGRAPILTCSLALDNGMHTFGTTLTEGTDYRLDKETGVVVLYGVEIPEGMKDVVKAEITYGWEADSLPAGIRRAIAWTTQFIAKMTSSNQIGISQRQNVDGGTETIEQSMVPAAVYKTLEYYRTGRLI